MITIWVLTSIASLMGFAGVHRLVSVYRVRRRLRSRRSESRIMADLGALCMRVRRGRTDPVNDLPAFLDSIARRCASGDSLQAAFVGAFDGHPSAALFSEARRALVHGATMREALEVRPVSAGEDALLAWHVLAMCARHGGSLNEPLDRTAATLRARQGMRHERQAQSAQARLSAQVLTVAPIAFACWTALTTPTVRQFLGSSFGVACMGLGGGLNLIGWKWMSRIVSSA